MILLSSAPQVPSCATRSAKAKQGMRVAIAMAKKLATG